TNSRRETGSYWCIVFQPSLNGTISLPKYQFRADRSWLYFGRATRIREARPMIRRAALAVLAASAFIRDAATAQTFPSRSMTIVVGYAAGGQADILARKVAQQLGENLKISVVVENRTGGNTLIASQSVARAPADGHTLILVTDGMTTIDPMVPGGNG